MLRYYTLLNSRLAFFILLFSCNSVSLSKIEEKEEIIGIANSDNKISETNHVLLEEIKLRNILLYNYLRRVGIIDNETIRAKEYLNLSYVMGLESLDGLEYFISLRKLKLSTRLARRFNKGEIVLPDQLSSIVKVFS